MKIPRLKILPMLIAGCVAGASFPPTAVAAFTGARAVAAGRAWPSIRVAGPQSLAAAWFENLHSLPHARKIEIAARAWKALKNGEPVFLIQDQDQFAVEPLSRLRETPQFGPFVANAPEDEAGLRTLLRAQFGEGDAADLAAFAGWYAEIEPVEKELNALPDLAASADDAALKKQVLKILSRRGDIGRPASPGAAVAGRVGEILKRQNRALKLEPKYLSSMDKALSGRTNPKSEAARELQARLDRALTLAGTIAATREYFDLRRLLRSPEGRDAPPIGELDDLVVENLPHIVRHYESAVFRVDKERLNRWRPAKVLDQEFEFFNRELDYWSGVNREAPRMQVPAPLWEERAERNADARPEEDLGALKSRINSLLDRLNHPDRRERARARETLSQTALELEGRGKPDLAHAALKGAVQYRFGRSLSYRQAQEIARYYLAAASPLPSLRPRLRMSAQKAAEVLPSLLENFEDFDFAPKILPLLGEARLPEFADVFSRIALRGKNAAVREAALDALRQSPSLPEAARDRLVMLLLDSSEAGGKTRRMNLTAAAILEKAASRKFALAGAIAGWTAGAAVSAAGLPFVGALLSLAGAYAGALRDFSGNTGLSPKLHLRTPELRSLFVAPVFSTAVAAACAFALLGLIRLAGGPQLALLETLAATGLAAGLVALHWSFKRP